MSRKLFDSSVFWVATAAAVIALGGIGVAIGAVNLSPHESPREPWFILGIVLACFGAVAVAWAIVLFLAHQHVSSHLGLVRTPEVPDRGAGDGTKAVGPGAKPPNSEASAVPDDVPWRDEPVEVADGLEKVRKGIEQLIAERALDRAKLGPLRQPEFDRATTARYYIRLRDDALALFDRAVDLGVVTKSERAKLEDPGGLNDVSLLPNLLQTLERRLRELERP